MKYSNLKKYIRNFSSATSPEQLVNGELGMVLHWNESLLKAKMNIQENDNDIRIILPKEGTLMWVDCIAIPNDAVNIENAHLFINFLLRDTVAAEITNLTFTPTTIKKSMKLLDESIKT